jgi:hypothetical protein
MNQQVNTESIRQLLNRSTAHLEQPALTCLRDARAQALARFDACSTAPVFVWAGSVLPGTGHISGVQQKFHFWVTGLLLAALLLSGASFFKQITEHDNTDVDIAILTDDLPIEVYVD